MEEVNTLQQWWLDCDTDNQRTAGLLLRKGITESIAQEWLSKNRLEKNLKKCGFKPMEATLFRIQFEQRNATKTVDDKNSILHMTMTDTELATLILAEHDLHKTTDILAALRRHAYAQGVSAMKQSLQ
jgi:hypothetical protein